MEWKVMAECRFCRCSEDGVFTHIFDDSPGEEPLVSKIWNCLSLKVSDDDGLPRVICHLCLHVLNRFNIFRKTCHESNTFFLKHYQPSFVRNTTHTEAVDVRKEPENVSHVSSDIGNVESSERTLHRFENGGNGVTDETRYVSLNLHSHVEFEEGPDSHVSNSQVFMFEQAPYVESVPKNESPFVTGIGCVVEGSERTLDGFESDGNDVTDESCSVSSRPCSIVELEGGSHLSDTQSFAFDQNPYVELAPENESPFVTGIGRVVEGSERTLDGFESDGNDVTDESCSVSSRPCSIVELEGGSHLSDTQSFAFDQNPYVELAPENESPFVTGIGYIVEGSERTLDGFESDGNDATDESCEFSSSPLSGTLPYLNSNEVSRGPEDPKAMHCVSFSQSFVNNSYTPLANSDPLTLAVGGGTACIHVAVHHHYKESVV